MLADAPSSLFLQGSPFTELSLTPDHTFTLTGSQYFGYARPESDWDFIVEDSPDVRAWLKTIGFSQLLNNEYKAKKGEHTATNAVMQHATAKPLVQIQLVPSAVRKIWVRDFIMFQPHFVKAHASMGKFERGQLWNGLDAVLEQAPQLLFQHPGHLTLTAP